MAGQFVLLSTVWGASFFLVKVALEGVQASDVAFGRLTVGAVALLATSIVTRSPLARGARTWAHLAVLGVLLCDLPFSLIAWAEQRLPSSEASLYNASTPLMTTLIAFAVLRHERLGAARLAGVGLGFLGVVVALAPWSGGFGLGQISPQLASLAAAACYGAGFVYLRRFLAPLRLPATVLATGQIAAAALVACVIAPFERMEPAHLSLRVVAAMLVLGALGTGAAYIWNANVIATWGAPSGSMVTYLIPIVGIVLGVVVRGEHFTWNDVLAAALIVCGVAFGQRQRPAVRRPRRDVWASEEQARDGPAAP